MKIFKLSFLAVSVFLLSYGVSNAQQLMVTADDVCATGQGSSNASLYRVNPNTAAFQEIGPIGFNGVGALAQIGDGRLVAGARADANGDRISILIEINPLTGQGTLIGTVGSDAGPGCGRINDLTYDPVTDTLYATAVRCEVDPPGDFLVTLLNINPDTAEATEIGQTGFRLVGNALAIDGTGTLFSTGTAGSELFFTIDPMNGVATQLADVPTEDEFFNSFVFNPFNGQLLGTSNRFPDTDLAIVNPFTGQFTVIGQLPDCADGMEFFELPPRPIPTLSEWGLIALAGLLGIVGFIAIRKKYAAV